MYISTNTQFTDYRFAFFPKINVVAQSLANKSYAAQSLTGTPGTVVPHRKSPVLSQHELQRLILDMVD